MEIAVMESAVTGVTIESWLDCYGEIAWISITSYVEFTVCFLQAKPAFIAALGDFMDE